MDKYELINKIKKLDGLTDEEKSALLGMLRSHKKYGLVWEDKPEEVEEEMKVKLPVLKEVKERAIINETDTEHYPNHFIIEGDNLHALTVLSYTHSGAFDIIYLDPPYNTGNKDFVYNDKFVDSEDNYRHSKWLSFMDKRLKIAKTLLSDKGAIFISIDDHEEAPLKMLCDEIFGEDKFVGCVSWQRTYSIRNDSKGIPSEVEYILVYSKQLSWLPNKLPRTEKMNAGYKNPDGDRCTWMSGSPVASDAATHQGMVYAIQNPFSGKMMYPSDKAHWRYSQEDMLNYMKGWCNYKLEDIHDENKRAEICGIPVSDVRKDIKAIVLADNAEEAKRKATIVLKTGPWPRFYFTNKGKGGIRRKVYIDSVGGRIATNYWPYSETGHTDEAKKELIKIFGKSPFDTPKPTRLIKRILDLASNKNSKILDFFAGSGTTMDATLQKNNEDGGSRQCVLATNNENGICEKVTYERNKRVINGYETSKGEQIEGLNKNNLRYYKTDFVARERTPKNMRDLVNAATDMLCIKENMYVEVKQFGPWDNLPEIALRHFTDGKGGEMLIIYREEVIEDVVDAIVDMDFKKKLKIYVFSPDRDPYTDEFEEVEDKVELCALPAAIYDAYREVVPRPDDPLVPIAENGEIASADIDIEDEEKEDKQ